MYRLPMYSSRYVVILLYALSDAFNDTPVRVSASVDEAPTGCQSSTRVESVAAEAWMKAGEHFACCSCLPLHVSQCVDGFDGMQVCRDLGDDLLVLTEWGGLERATSLLGSSCSCWSNGQRVRGLEEPR